LSRENVRVDAYRQVVRDGQAAKAPGKLTRTPAGLAQPPPPGSPIGALSPPVHHTAR
jgi:hypothetical protein